MDAARPSTDLLRTSLASLWDLQVNALRRLQVGSPDSHHYLADTSRGQFFVTVDDLRLKARLASEPDAAFDLLEAALGTVHFLRHSVRLEFVLAPVMNRNGRTTARLSWQHSLAIYPFVEGTAGGGDSHVSAADRRVLLSDLGRLHATKQLRERVRRDPLDIPERHKLTQAIDDLGRPWGTGPYAEPTRALLDRAVDAVLGNLHRYDSLAGVLGRTTSTWVLTHGEPHSGNTLRAADGSLLLLDWDTLAVAPRERDLWMVFRPELAQDQSAYASAASETPINGDAMRLYKLWWELAEIAEYVGRFRQPHGDSPADRSAWEELGHYLPVRDDIGS
jgi:spectinomycin phosphotransferase